MATLIERLAETVEKFQRWAALLPPGRRSAEWEMDYGGDDWRQMLDAARAVLSANCAKNPDAAVIGMLLYVLARDNEEEALKDEIVGSPDWLLTLSEAGLRSDEFDARWQLASALGESGLPAAQIEPLLRSFFLDDDEYVSRRALLAMGDRRLPGSATFAKLAWERGEEYQRMAALHVFQCLNSPELSTYLDLADQDGREYLQRAADRIRAERATSAP